jgi:hypothetical protein
MMLGDELRDAVQAAYEAARAQAAAQDPPETIPAWEVLSLPMRIAFLHVFSAGRRVGADEAEEQHKRIDRLATDQG